MGSDTASNTRTAPIPGRCTKSMRKFKIIVVILLGTIVYFLVRPSNKKLIADLNSKKGTTVKVNAAYKLGERKEKTAIVPLLTHILDPSTSTSIRYKGMTVCYARLVALRKISGIKFPTTLKQYDVDTAAANFYLNWARKENYIKSGDIDLKYYR